MAIPRWISNTVGRAAQVTGRTYDYLTPGAGTSTLTNVGRNIVDPNVVYTGGLTPAGAARALASPQSEFRSTTSAAAPAPDPGGTRGTQEQTPDISLMNAGMSGGGVGDGGVAAAPAIDYAAVGRAKGDISTLIQSIGNLYDTIYGKQSATAQEQLKNLEESYGKGTQALAETFAAEMPKLQASYNARGTGDSTEAMTAAYQSGKGYESQLESRAQELAGAKTKLGEFLTTSRAGMEAQRGAYTRALQDLQGSTDLNELTSFRNSLDQRIAELEAQAAGTMTETGFREALGQAIPRQPDIAQLQGNLTTIIQGQAAPGIKKSVGLRMINLSSLPETTKRQLSADFSASVDAEEEQLQQPIA